MSNVKTEYLPGVCNIGVAEKRTRRRAGWVGLALTVVLWILFFVFRVGPPWRLFLFLPSMLAASGFLQAAMSFCVNFGMRGVHNFGDNVGSVTVVAESDAKRRDRIHSLQITLFAALIAAAVAVAGLLTG